MSTESTPPAPTTATSPIEIWFHWYQQYQDATAEEEGEFEEEEGEN